METKSLINKYWREVLIVGLIITLILAFTKCQPQEDTKIDYKDVEVKIPEINGEFEKPSKETELPSAGADSIVYKDRVIYSTHPLNKEWAEKVKKAKDSIQILNLLVESIQERENITDFSNDDLELKVHTKVRGELKDVTAKYKIKERTAIVQEKTITKTIIEKDPSGFVVGGGYNHSLDTNTKSSFEGNAGFRLGKVTVLGGLNTNLQVSGKLLIEL